MPKKDKPFFKEKDLKKIWAQTFLDANKEFNYSDIQRAIDVADASVDAIRDHFEEDDEEEDD